MFKEYFEYILEETQIIFEKIISFLPSLLFAVIIILLTLLIAKLMKNLSNKLFRIIGINVFSKRTGIDRFLKPSEISSSISELLALAVYWIIIFLGIVYAVMVLGLDAAKDLIDNVINYLPNLLIAIVILVVGIYLAGFFGKLTKKIANAAKLTYASFLEYLVRSVILLFAILGAIEELTQGVAYFKSYIYFGIAGILIMFLVIFAIASIGYLKAFMAWLVLKNHLACNETVVYKEREGIIEKITWFVTIIRHEKELIYVKNDDLLISLKKSIKVA